MGVRTVRSPGDLSAIRSVCLAILLALTCASWTGGCRDAAPAKPETIEAPAAPESWFADFTERSGIQFVHNNGHRERYLMPENVGSGVALFDMDGDGDLDVYAVQAGNPVDQPDASTRQPNQLFRNRGDATFEAVADAGGAPGKGYGMGVACGDYDRDGDIDLYVTSFGENVLYQNDGRGHFTDVSADAGVAAAGWGTSAVFFDYDRDGDLDLFVLNYLAWTVAIETACYNPLGDTDYCGPTRYDAPARALLYRNDGAGHFGDVTVEAGVTEPGNGLGVLDGDFNGDGWPDLFVANDGMPDRLWINLGNGRFEDRGLMTGCSVGSNGKPTASMGVTAGDIDDDGDLDLMVCNLTQEADSLFINHGTYFVEGTAAAGVMTVSRPFTRFGMGWADFNNDGYLDLYQVNGRVQRNAERYGDDPYAEPNLLFRGESGGRFVEILPRGGTLPALYGSSRGLAFGDIDNDGGLDALVLNNGGPLHVLRNIVPRRGHWLAFRVLDEHGADAIGATLKVTLGQRVVSRDVRTAYSYLSSNDPRVHFGLGTATRVETVIVHWPRGGSERFGPFTSDQIVTLHHGKGTKALPAP